MYRPAPKVDQRSAERIFEHVSKRLAERTRVVQARPGDGSAHPDFRTIFGDHY